MLNRSGDIKVRAGRRSRVTPVAAVALVCGLLAGGTASVVAAQDTAGGTKAADLQSYPAPGTTGDRGVQRVYREARTDAGEAAQSIQRAPAPASAGDRGVNLPGHVRGQEVYMGRLSSRGIDSGAPRGTAGDRGVNRAFTARSDATRLEVEEMQNIIDEMQAMYDRAQADLDRRWAAFYYERYNPAPGTSGDRGIHRVYRPERSGHYVPDYSGDDYQAPPAGTAGDRGVERVYRDARSYRERAAHERSGQRTDLYGLGGFTLPAEQVELERIVERLDELEARLDGRRGAAGRGTAGDRGTNRAWHDRVNAQEQARLEWEQRRIEHSKRRLDRLQRKLDRQIARFEESNAGDRGVNVARPGAAASVQMTLAQLFAQLDMDQNQALSEDEAKRLSIVENNFDALDDDANGLVTMSEFTDIIQEADAL